METIDKIISSYTQLLKTEIEILAIFKKGNYEHKATQIKECERCIEFYKEMRLKFKNKKLKS